MGEAQRVASMHPLWGASTRVLSGKNCLVLDCGNDPAACAAEDLFAGTAARLQRLPLEEHDRAMAYTLGLPHALNLLFGDVLSASPYPFEALRTLGGPTFLKQSAVAAEVASENREMYRQIQHLNPHTAGVDAALRSAIDALAIRRADPAAFAQRMAQDDTYFARFREWWP